MQYTIKIPYKISPTEKGIGPKIVLKAFEIIG
jgi:hypothetical protein